MHTLNALLDVAFFDGQTRGNYKPLVAVFFFGMIVGIAGHLTESRELILAGIGIAGVATILPWALWE